MFSIAAIRPCSICEQLGQYSQTQATDVRLFNWKQGWTNMYSSAAYCIAHHRIKCSPRFYTYIFTRILQCKPLLSKKTILLYCDTSQNRFSESLTLSPLQFSHQILGKWLKSQHSALLIFTTCGFWTSNWNSPFLPTLKISTQQTVLKSTLFAWKHEETSTDKKPLWSSKHRPQSTRCY